MMRCRALALLVLFAPALFAQDPPAVPQAVAALEHLKPRADQGPTSWTAGAYLYDGAGNIKAIGTESFAYDKLSRLKVATIRGPDAATLQTQTYDYDAYGNLISTSRLGQTVNLTTIPATNRLQGIEYDDAGNVIAADTQHYNYDAVGMLNTMRIGASAQPRMIYAYTADDERLFAFDVSTGTTHWTLRGLDNKVLRDFKQTGATWTLERDYVYRDGVLLAALKPGGEVEHYTVDHLGTPRLITNAAGQKIAYHAYWPFGEEWSPATAQEAPPLKFTAHERDPDPTGGTAPLDYMHARYYRAGWGRFLSVDPGQDWDLRKPQFWSLYSYVRNNPMRFVDPTGREGEDQKPKLKPRYQPQPHPTAPDGSLLPPPIPLPPGKSGKPNQWVPVVNPNPRPGQRPVKWKPRDPIPNPKGAQPSGSWDPEGHYDVDFPATDGDAGDRDRVLPDGTRLGPHHEPLTRSSWVINAQLKTPPFAAAIAWVLVQNARTWERVVETLKEVRPCSCGE